MTITSAELAAVRREALGDSQDATTVIDEDIEWFFDGDGAASVLLTAALVCDMLSNRAAQHFSFTADGQSMHMADRQAQYRDNAVELRRRYHASGTITATRPAVTSSTTSEFAL